MSINFYLSFYVCNLSIYVSIINPFIYESIFLSIRVYMRMTGASPLWLSLTSLPSPTCATLSLRVSIRSGQKTTKFQITIFKFFVTFEAFMKRGQGQLQVRDCRKKTVQPNSYFILAFNCIKKFECLISTLDVSRIII